MINVNYYKVIKIYHPTPTENKIKLFFKYNLQSEEKIRQIQIKAKKPKINILYFLAHMIIP